MSYIPYNYKNIAKSYFFQLTKLRIFCILIKSVVTNGILAQLGEHLPYKQRVTGSSPVGPITYISKYNFIWRDSSVG